MVKEIIHRRPRLLPRVIHQQKLNSATTSSTTDKIIPHTWHVITKIVCYILFSFYSVFEQKKNKINLNQLHIFSFSNWDIIWSNQSFKINTVSKAV
jgi:hypothetical protein